MTAGVFIGIRYYEYHRNVNQFTTSYANRRLRTVATEFWGISPQNSDSTGAATLARILQTFHAINRLTLSSSEAKSPATWAFQSGSVHAMCHERYMQDRTLYSIHEARRLLGGISRNGIYGLLRSGKLASVVIGCRRFISDAAIAALINKATTTVSPSQEAVRLRRPLQRPLQLLSPATTSSSPRKSSSP
jgi:hypothetical protein